MSAAEIILLILGFVSVCLSFVMGNKEKEAPDQGREDYQSKDIWTEKEEKIVRRQMEAILGEEKDNVITETTEYLNRKSNEKIMEFDEFTSQILEKINHNHEEVVFMYNMLTEKENEIKDLMAKPTSAARSKNQSNKSYSSSNNRKQKVNKKTQQQEQKEASKQLPAEEKSVESQTGSDNSVQIVRMYKQGKSVLDISKELNIGQGEVKLMISLYGGDK